MLTERARALRVLQMDRVRFRAHLALFLLELRQLLQRPLASMVSLLRRKHSRLWLTEQHQP